MERVRKPEEILARLAVRLAPAVAKELNDLKWERGTIVGETPLTGETRPPGMSRGRVVNSHATPP